MVICDKNLKSSNILSKFLFITFFIQKFRSAFSGIGICGEKDDAGTEMYHK